MLVSTADRRRCPPLLDLLRAALKLDTSTGPGPAPTVTIGDIDRASKLEGQDKNGEVVPVPVARKVETVGAVSLWWTTGTSLAKD